MTGITLRAAMLTVILSAWMLQSAEAQVRTNDNKPGYARISSAKKNLFRPVAQRQRVVRHEATAPVVIRGQAPARLPRRIAARSLRHADLGRTAYAGRMRKQPAPQAKYAGKGYPYLNAPLYASPLPNIPYQVGGAVYTNQAFAPHEMLHEHEYKALYGPFYHKVRGSWLVTPWGVWSSDSWKLEGTKVEVEYEPHISWFSGFVPPRVH